MSWQDPRLWAALISVDGIGQKTFSKVIASIQQKHVSAEDFWRSPDTIVNHFSPLIRENIKKTSQAYSLDTFWELLHEKHISVLTENEAEYPALLKQIPDRPPVLFIKGKHKDWDTLPISVVGTRHATLYGQLATEKLVRELVGFGCTIISGFMYGIDLLAHQAADNNGCKTIGVLGFGFDYLYPRSQARIFEEMLAAGHTFLTEFAPQVRPTKGTFVSRNRIVAGMSKGVVVVEAAAKSGSLITAQAALEYGREVMAVPGPINSIYSEGTAALVNQGASLVTSGRQILENIGFFSSNTLTQTKIPLADAFQNHIYTQLKKVPQTSEQLHLEMGKSMGEVLTALSMMEVAGWLKRTGDVWAINV